VSSSIVRDVRVVLLTTGGEYGQAVAGALRRRGVLIEAIVVDLHVPRPRNALRRPRRAVGPVRRWYASRDLRQCARLLVIGNANASGSIRLLRALGPDLILLGGARVLSADVLAIPAFGTLNAHPAYLPGFRGTGVVGRAILAGEPVAVSVHFASAEVDAGDVVERQLVPIEEGDTVGSIQRRADQLCAEALAEVAARAVRGEQLPREPQEEPGAISQRLTPAELEQAEARVASGEVLRRYRQTVDA
jgi:methionyl-tRNA formyltransferase